MEPDENDEIEALEWARRGGTPGSADRWALLLLERGHARVGFRPTQYRLTEKGPAL